MFPNKINLVGDVMTRQVVCVDDTDRLSDAIRFMDQNGLRAVPVVDNQNVIVGLLSTSDLLSTFHEVQSDLNALHCLKQETQDFFIQLLLESGDNTCVRDVMRTPVTTTTEATTLVDAAKTLAKAGYHHLPVVAEDGRPVGIISNSDFVRVIAEKGALLSN